MSTAPMGSADSPLGGATATPSNSGTRNRIDLPAPLKTYDVHEDSWKRLRGDDRDRIRHWLHHHGIDPHLTYRIEIYLIDCPSARIFEYEADPSGRKVKDGSTRTPYDIPLSNLPPAVPK